MRYNTNQINLNFQDGTRSFNDKLTYGEFFAGGGGCASAANKNPMIELRWLLNHDKVAIKTNAFHTPDVKVYWADIHVQDEHELEPVDIIQASFECDYHTPAIGGAPIDISSYMMGWELYRYMVYLQPLVLTVENVPGVKNWAPLGENGQPDKERAGEEFERWKKALMDLGYCYKESIRNAADDGLPTRRKRYFAIFYREGIEAAFPEFTHNEHGTDGKEKWQACKGYIDLNNQGQSIFGRQFNEALPKQHRKPLSKNTLRRIAGGIKKYAPEFNHFISTYYGGEAGKNRGQSLDKPLNTQTTENRHQLVSIEKMQFIQDYCHGDFWQLLNEPLYPQLTRQTKQVVTIEDLKFIQDHCHSDSYQSLEEPLDPQTTRQTKQIVSIEQMICQYYGTDQQQSIDTPLNTIPCVDRHQLVTIEKLQFISHYFNSNGKPETNNQSLDKPLNSLTTHDKAQLVTLLDNLDIKVRFLDREELAEISTFPRDYFSKPGLKLSHKDAVKLIGNAVPPEWYYKILECNVDSILEYKQALKSA